MANEIGSYIVNIQAKVEGYQTEIDKIKKALSEVGANTQIGKDLGKQLAAVERQVDSLARKMTQRISSESQITRLKDQLDNVDTSFQRIGNTLQQVQFKDLDTTKFTQSLSQMTEELNKLQSELTANMSSGFDSIIQKWMSNGDKFSGLLQRLKIDPKELNYENFSEVFKTAMENARNEAAALQEQINELTKQQREYNANAKAADKNANFDPTDITNKFLGKFANIDITSISKEKVQEFQDTLNRYLQGLNFKDDTISKKIQPLIDNLINSTTTGEFQRKLATFQTELQKALQFTNKGDFTASLKNANIDPKQLFNFDNFLQVDTQKLDQISTALGKLFDKTLNVGGDSDKAAKLVEEILKAFTSNDPTGAIKKVTEALEEYRKEQLAIADINRTNSGIVNDQIDQAKIDKANINRDLNSANGYNTNLVQRINQLVEDNKNLQKQIDELKQLLQQANGEAVKKVRDVGRGIQDDSTKGLEDNARAAQQYAQQLEHVKEAEKMVGKIEGIAQRWFSIYAAVRMVTNAIRSMKQTIEELDKTITEIAIVTNMSQSDLWGQMGKYTQLAREYAASIQGVYQVSQLYYQQGLQTKEVMELTEQTLKMARISGLDYADATDYMTNAIRSFKMEMSDAQRVVDVYSAIAASSATNVTELAEAMSKTASSAEAVGSSFENTTAMMAVMIEATREAPQNIGSALKSIISRYGEMKADPAKLVDSEGEELSFNKVDTALQSVGISIKNAEGQFRNFDEVIEELAASWDTIDVNTQRYIATIMAGNRQQSRFLALVSNYDRYRDLSAKAAEAENASQLQFLKTLDSVQAKTQQLQTSLQSLYTDSGIENFYKGLLDISNMIIQSFTSMPTLFNLPIAAVIKFGTTFYSLANIVTSVFGIITNKLAVHKVQIFEQQQRMLNNEQQVQNSRVELEANANRQIIQNRKNMVNELLFTEKGKQQASAAGANLKAIDSKVLGLNIGALVVSAGGAALKSTNNGGAQFLGGLLSAGGQAASMAAMGTMMGGPAGTAIGAVAGAALGIIQNADVILQTSEQRLKNLTTISDEAKNKALMEQAEAKSLQASIDKLKELEKTRYSSIEAEQAYLEASDTLAQQYPQLINAYDETGKALINTESASRLLVSSLQEVVNATEAASTANFKLALERYQEEQRQINQLKENKPTDEGKGFGSKNQQLWYFLDQNRKGIDEEINLALSDYASEMADVYDIEGLFNANFNEVSFNDEFKKYITNYLTNAFDVFSTTRPELNVSELNKTEKVVYEYIEGLINEFASVPTREEANKKTFQESVKANIMSDINSYIALIEATEDSNPFEGMDEAAALIKNYVIKQQNIDSIDSVEEWNQAISAAQETTKKYYETLKNWYIDIDKETYNSIMSFKGKVSSKKLIDMLRNAFPEMEDNIIKAFEETFKDNFNITKYTNAVSKIDNSEIQEALNEITTGIFGQLSDSERQTILEYGKQIESMISNNNLTQNQGMQNLQKYLAIWSELRVAPISDEQREAAEELLRTWDGTREGLEAIKESLKDVEGAEHIIKSVDDLQKIITQNLNTVFSTLTTNIAGKIKDFKEISALSKGVDIEKAVKYVDQLGLNFTDLELDYSTGLYKIKDINILLEKYFKNLDSQLENARNELEKYTNKSVTYHIENTLLNADDLESTNLDSIYNDIYNQTGLTKKQVIDTVTKFKEYQQIAGENAVSYLDWLKNSYEDLANALNKASQDAQSRAALNSGNISSFIETILPGSDLQELIVSSIINTGKIDIKDIEDSLGGELDTDIKETLIKYFDFTANTLKDINKNIFEKAIESINNGSQQIIVNESNYQLINRLLNKEYTEDDAKKNNISETLDWSNDTADYLNKVKLILEDTQLSDDEKNSLLSSLESAVYNIDTKEAFNTIINSYTAFGIEAANKFAQATGKTLEQLGFVFDANSGKFSTSLESIRAYVADEENNLTERERNEALALIDKKLRESSHSNAFADIANNYSNLSEEIIQEFADKIGMRYDDIKSFFSKNADGTYSTDLAHLTSLQRVLGLTADEAARKVIDSVIDEYLNQLSNISKSQTAGYTNISDMRAVADKFANGDLGIFQWDKELKAYTLTNEGIMQQASAAAKQLASLDQNSEEYKKAYQLMQADGQALADNIDFLGLIATVGTDDYVEAAMKFSHNVAEYNSYLEGSGKEIKLDANNLRKAAKEGGLTAVRAAQVIAEQAGKKLSGADIETIYRSSVERINTALSQMTLSIGSVIDETTVELLGIDNQVQNLGSGKAVITSAINMVKAYENLYKRMQEETGHTLAELNNIQAKIATEKEQGTLLESLSNISEMSYETLGQIATNIGTSFDALYNLLIDNNALQNLGGGKIRITNFDYFAQLTGLLDESTEEYIKILSSYNDSIIEANRSRANAVINELKAVSEAKSGDQVNITKIWGALDDFGRTALTSLLESYGASVENGILNINNANIGDILGILQETSKNIRELTERDKAEIEDAFVNFIQKITDSIKNGLQGNLSNVGKLDLIEGLKNYGLTMEDSDFTKTAEGWQLTKAAAFEVYTYIKDIDDIQGDLVLKELTNALEEDEARLRSISSFATELGTVGESSATNYKKRGQVGQGGREFIHDLGYQIQAGNVDLVNHAKHKISAEDMLANGWDIGEDNYATLFSSTLAGNEQDIIDIPFVFNITPISNDGTQLKNPDQLVSYTNDVISKALSSVDGDESAVTKDLLLQMDSEHLLMGVYEVDEALGNWDETIATAEKECERLHEESSRIADVFETISDINLMKATSKDNSLDFMNNKMPDAMQNPITYAENWGKAINILQKGSGTKKGFVNAQDWYNIVNEMNNIASIGGDIEMYGVKLNGSLESASELIQLGFDHLKSIDGGKLEVDLSQLGVAFKDGAMGMEGDITQGIHAMAESQIHMLDGLIAMLETIVQMQEAFEGLDVAEDNKLELDELFPKIDGSDLRGPSEDMKTAAQRMLEAFEYDPDDPKNVLNQIKVNNKALGQWFKDVQEEVELTDAEAKGLTAAINGLYQASLSGNYDTNNIYESVKEILKANGLMDGSVSIDIGTTTLYLTGNTVTSIDWDSKKTREAIKEAYGSYGDKTKKEAQAAMEQWSKNPLEVKGKNLTFILKYNGIEKKVDKDTGEEYWTVDGKRYNSEEAAAKALVLKQAGVNKKDITVDKNGNVTSGTIHTKDGKNIEIDMTGEKPVYNYDGYTGSTAEEAIRKWVAAHTLNWKELTEDQQDELVVDQEVKMGLKVTPTFKVPENFKPTMDDTQKVLDLINQKGGKLEGKDVNELGIGIKTTEEGPLTAQQVKELAELVGGSFEAKAIALTVNTDGITAQPLADLITKGTGNAELSLTLKPGETPSLAGDGTGTENGTGIDIGEIPVTGKLIITPSGAPDVDLGTDPVDAGEVNLSASASGLDVDTTTLTSENTKASLPEKTTTNETTVIEGKASGANIDGQGLTEEQITAIVDATVPASTDPTVEATAKAFVVDVISAMQKPSFKKTEDKVKFNSALTVMANIAKFVIGNSNGTETSDGTSIGADAQLKAAIVPILSSILTNGAFDLNQKIDMLIQLGKYVPDKKVTPEKPNVEMPDDWKDEQGNFKTDLAITALFKLAFGKSPESDDLNAKVQEETNKVPTELPEKTVVQPVKILVKPTPGGDEGGLFDLSWWNTGDPSGGHSPSVDESPYGGASEMGYKGMGDTRPHFAKAIINESFSARNNPGQNISQEDINNVKEMGAAIETVGSASVPPDLSTNLGAVVTQVQQFRQISGEDTQGNLFTITEGFTSLTAIEPTGIQSCVSALEELITKLNILKDYDWASVLQKLSQLFGGNSGENGENSSLGATGNLGVNVNATYSDTYVQELMANQNITRTITVNIKKGTDETNGGPTDETVDKTTNDGGNTGGGGTTQNVNQNLNATASLDTGDLDSKLATLSQSLGSLGTALTNIPTGKEQPVNELAESMGKIPSGKGDLVDALASAMSKIPSGKDDDIKSLTKAINAIPKRTEINIYAKVSAEFEGKMKPLSVYVHVYTTQSGAGGIGRAAGNVKLGSIVGGTLTGSYKTKNNKLGKANAGGTINTVFGPARGGDTGDNDDPSTPKVPKFTTHVSFSGDIGRNQEAGQITLAKNGYMGKATHVIQVSPSKETVHNIQMHAQAKGNQKLLNAAYPKGKQRTLVGELGPELVVSNGGYYLVGQNGAEFIDLASDAIVFNHRDTAKLLSLGHTNRGKPITNESKAISWAKGAEKPLGPAQASASAALAALKQLRAMWASMLNTSAQQLGGQAGRGGGGGGKGKEKDEKGNEKNGTVLNEIQRWYNLERKIAECEEKIALAEQKQATYESDRIANGKLIYEQQKKQLDKLREEVKYNQQLSNLQKSWYQAKVKELEGTAYGQIFVYDKNTGLMQYRGNDKPGSGQGLDILENINRTDKHGKPIDNAATAKAQLEYLAKHNFDLTGLLWDDQGNQVAKSITVNSKGNITKLDKYKEDKETDDSEIYKKMMENFYNQVDGWRDELDSLWESYNDQLTKIEENQQKQNEILQAWVDNELDVEQKLLEAVEAREQEVIDKLNEQKTALEKSTQSFVDGLKEQLDREKDIQSKNDEQEVLTKLQRQLAILQRSGGSASQIKSLQDQIASKQQDMYYNGRQNEIDTIQKAADKQLERLDKQIEILTETLEYQKKNGLFWDEIREIMDKSEEYATSFYNEWVVGKSGNSILQQGEDIREFKELFQQWVGYRTDKQNEAAQQAAAEQAAAEEAAWQNKIDTVISQDSRFKEQNESILGSMNSTDRQTASDTASSKAKEAYESAIQANPEDEDAANAAAAEAYNKSLQDSKAEFTKRDRTAEFEKKYTQWKKNRLLADAYDYTTTTTFKNNEGKFKESLLNNYLANYDNYGNDAESQKQLWNKIITEGEKAINSASQAATQAGKVSAANAQAYSLNRKTQMGSKKSKTYKKKTKLTFDDADTGIVPVNGKNKKSNLLHIKGTKYWVRVNDISSGSSIFNKLMTGQLSNSVASVGGDTYTPTSSIKPEIKIGKLKRADLKFKNNKVEKASGGTLGTLTTDGNAIRIGDIQGLKANSKGEISSFSKLQVTGIKRTGKDSTYIATKPTWIKSTSGLLKRLNAYYKKDKNSARDILTYLNAYAEGGMADFTGPAWLDGTKKRPEAVLNPDQTKFLREDLLGRQENSLMSIVQRLQKDYSGTLETNAGENIIFENIDVTFEAGTISNDYDMRRASEMFKDELVKMARKSGSRSVARR